MKGYAAHAARLSLGGAFFIYFNATVALYFVGPWRYPNDSPAALIAFLAAAHLGFAAGYWFGIRGQGSAVRLPVSIDTLVLAAVLAELLLLFPTSAYTTGQWIPDPVRAIRDFGGEYTRSVLRRASGVPYVFYVRIFLAPLLALAVPLGVFYWPDLSRKTRVLLVASIVGTIVLHLAMGANAGAAHWAITFPWFVLAAAASRRIRITPRGWIAAGALLVASIVLLVAVFATAMAQRRGSPARLGYAEIVGAHLGDQPPVADAAGTIQPDPTLERRSSVRLAADGLALYLTQGYQAVHLSLHQEFVPCYGAGNSMFLQRQVARFTGASWPLECSYPARLHPTGAFVTRYWTTIHPWIASDVSFPGVVLVMVAIGWLSGRVWSDVLHGGNPIAVALLGQVLILLYYVPAHNKTMQTGENISAFGVLLVGWLLTRYASRT